MSLILDALNRSQAERGSEGDVPGIETQHWVEPSPYARGWQRGLPWFALGLALLVIVWLLFGRNDEPAKVQATVSAPVAAQVAVVPRSDSTEAKRVEPRLSKVSSPAPASADNLIISKLDIRQKPTGNSTAVANLYSPADGGEASVAVAPVPEQRKNKQTIDIEKMIILARREAKNTKLSEHSTPFLSQLSQQKKDQVATIYYTQHDYSSSASQSSVTLNGKLMRVGDGMSGTLKLLEILPNSVVLTDRGTEFRLRALNSWVNL